MVFVLAMAFTACSSNTQDTTQPSAAGNTTAQSATNASAEDTEGAKNGKTLVVYFSATGNTEEAANYIAEATGGDLFELVPADPYTDADLDWTDSNSRVTREHENPDQREVELTQTTVDNWAEYDTVFIGYPIWLAYHKLIQCTQLA